jgi:uncharacterized protein (DUF488 family)
MKLFTIGFTKKNAETFFGALREAGVKHLVDVRLNNISQLAGFTKRDDLAYFAKSICGIAYSHRCELAPTAEMLKTYKTTKVSWAAYENRFNNLLAERRIEKLDRAPFDGACLLCSEATPHHCHRRLVAEYLGKHWPDVSITHL